MPEENKSSERYKVKQMQKWLSPDPLPNVRSLFIAEQKALLRLAVAVNGWAMSEHRSDEYAVLEALAAFDFEAD